MASKNSNGNVPIVLHTERLTLRLADPDSDADCLDIIRIANDWSADKSGNSKVGLGTIADVRKKYDVCGPRPEYCTLATPPYGMFFLVYLPSSYLGGQETLTGLIGISFRPEMPYPDLGYATLEPYRNQGYTTEAGRKALEFWRDTIGVKNIWCGTAPDNKNSQRCAERLGFVRAGNFNVVLGQAPNYDARIEGCVAFVLPGMSWTDGLTIYPTIH